jgi:spore coat protein U-like protein
VDFGPKPGFRLLVAVAAMLAAALALGPAPAAATITANTCSITSTGLTFSPYDSVNKNAVDGTGTLTVTCGGSGNNTLTMGLTIGGGASCAGRRMASGANLLSYRIFRESARTNDWCDTSTTRVSFAMNFPSGTTTRTVNVTMYGRIPLGQNPAVGSNYLDTLTATLRSGTTQLAQNINIPIRGSVPAMCSVSTVALDFGSYTTTAAALGSAAVTVSCTLTATYQVGLGPGGNSNAAGRRMASPSGSLLAYSLYRDSPRTLLWGDGTTFGGRLAGTGSGANQALNVYGTIPAGQVPPAGSYGDSVVVTVEY